jgi:preprotein translocase subunit SecA
VRPEVDAFHAVTTRENLADREFKHYKELLSELGLVIHRMNPDTPPPAAVKGEPTIYVGERDELAFGVLKSPKDLLPGQRDSGNSRIERSDDEIDEALVYARSDYILSEGVQRRAPKQVAVQVRAAAAFLDEHLGTDGHPGTGKLTEADFGRAAGQEGGPAVLTLGGLEKVAGLLGEQPSNSWLHRLDMAAAARFEYLRDIHYVVDELKHKIYLINQTTHGVEFNPKTSTETRLNGGLAQAIEARENLPVRADPVSHKSTTTQQLLARPEYGRIVGASGTANGHGGQFAAMGLTSQIEDIPRYYHSRLGRTADHVTANIEEKLDAIAAHVAATQASGRPQPQLVLAHRNDLVARLSEKLEGVPHTAIDAR